MGADEHVDVAEREPLEKVAALAAALAAGQDRDLDAGGGGERCDRLEVLAREDLGRRHQRGLPAAFDHGGGGEQRHHGLARADVALQQPQHAFGLGEIGDDVGDRARLRRGQRIGQGLDQLLAQLRRCRWWRGRRAGADARAPARAQAGRPGTRHRRAASRRRRRERRRPARAGGAACAARWRKDGKRSRATQLGSCHSGRSGRRSSAPLDGLADLIEAEAFGQRIDRLDQRQLGEVRLVHHAVGMHHLQHAVVERDRAGHVAPLADRQELLQVILARVEIGEDEIAGLVAGVDLVGRARPVRRRRPVAVDGDRDGDDGVGLHIAQLRPRAAVDRAGRQVEQQIDDARHVVAAEQAAIELLDLRPDAGQARERREQRIEHVWPHARFIHLCCACKR